MYYYYNKLTHTESSNRQGCQVGAHLLDRSIFCLALHNSWWADLSRTGRWWWALGRFRALDFWATRARAWGAFTRRFVAFGTVKNYGHLFRYRTLQDIIRQVRNWRTFRLQHIFTQIWHCGAWRNCRF